MKNLMIFLVFIGIVGGVAMKYVNAFPVLDETVKEKWAQVQNQYKRRADLIPNLVKTVQGYAGHEEGVFREVTEARSKATQMTLDVSALDDPAKLKEFEAAQKTLGGALSRLMAITKASLRARKIASRSPERTTSKRSETITSLCAKSRVNLSPRCCIRS